MRLLMIAQRRPYASWLERKFLAWQTSQDSRKTVTEFAEFLGFPKQTVTNWLNDQRLPSPENANELAIKLGYDVSGHALLGLSTPNIKWLKVSKVWDVLTDEEQKKYLEEIERDAQANIAAATKVLKPEKPKRGKRAKEDPIPQPAKASR